MGIHIDFHCIRHLNISGTRISMNGKGRATDNAIIEAGSEHSKKYVYLKPPQTGLSLFNGIRTFMDKNKYNYRRHQGINRKKKWTCINEPLKTLDRWSNIWEGLQYGFIKGFITKIKNQSMLKK